MKSKNTYLVILIAAAFVIALFSMVIIWPRIQQEGDDEEPYFGQRKAIILCSANDFYGSEDDDFNNGNDSGLGQDNSLGNWTFDGGGATDGYHANGFGHVSGPPGSIFIENSAGGPLPLAGVNFTLDWNAHYDLYDYVFYNMSAWIYLEYSNTTSGGARIGLQWLNSSAEVVRTDWSENITESEVGIWKSVNVSGVCNNDTNNEITQLKLVLSAQGEFSPTPYNIYFDEIKISRWVQVNLTDPSTPPPPPGKLDSDGFPAQALQVYKILKKHDYSDENILLMLYYKDDADGIVDIDQNDGIPDDLVGAVIDIANDSVTAARFKQELDVSVSGSFASNIHPEDQLIIYMTDHGSNKILGDGNATFHFESDGSTINETEFYNLVKEIDCARMLINIDCCFSGNFLNYNSSIGQAWYDIPNSVLVSSSANVLSWYWVYSNNNDGWAGSWFFHVFWDHLDQGQTVQGAFNLALGFMPSVNPPAPLVQIQNPLMHDNLGIANSWSFSSTPQL